MIGKRHNLYYLVGLVVLIGLESNIFFPKLWYIHVAIWTIVLLLARWQIGSFQVTGWYRGVGSLVIPGSTMLFFVEIPVWQHVYAVIFSILIAYLFYWIKNYITNPNNEKTTLLFALCSVFFTVALALGLHIFFRIPTYYTAAAAIILISIFPFELTIKLRQKSLASAVVNNTQLKRAVSIWFNQSVKKGYLQELIKFKLPQKGIFSRIKVSRFKLVLLFISLELYLAVITLPVNIVVSSALVVVILYALVSLLQYAQLKVLNQNLVYHYMGLSIFLVILILVTAQWS